MKVKLKLDKATIVDALVAHSEKLVFGVFVVMFLLLCIGALKQKPYDKTPDKFKQEAQRVEQIINNGKATDEDFKDLPSASIPDHQEIAKTTFAGLATLNIPISAGGAHRRGEPPFLTVQDVHVAMGYGAISVRAAGARPAAGAPQGMLAGAAPAGPTSFQGKQWAVITAVIPAPQQLQAFRTTFANAPQGKRDIPDWRSFEVERQEGDGPWTKLDLRKLLAAESLYTKPDADAVDKRFVAISRLCRVLPPLLQKTHDKSVVHPKIAQLSAEREAQVPGGPKPAGLQPAMQPVINQGMGGMNPAARNDASNESDYKFEQMFRYFDYTVQPGKSYRYRVRLVLENPNFDLQRYQVESAEQLKGKTRATPWSEPSSLVNVPLPSSILAGAVKASKSVSQEPSAEVVLVMWNATQGVDALKFARLLRGQMANFNLDTPIKPVDGGPAVKKLVHFQTNQVLLDLAGGDSLPGYRGRAPGRMLLYSPGGELNMKSELTDIEAYEADEKRVRELQDAVDAVPEETDAPKTAAAAGIEADAGSKGRKRER